MYKAMGRGERDLEDYTHHWSVRWTQRILPVHPQLEGERFFVRRDQRWRATPLFLCLVTVEASDVAFAFDSVPAVIAVTREPVLVYTSNIFAILGLRSLYFVLIAARNHLQHLEKAVVAILVFVGVKLLLEAFDAKLAGWLGYRVDISAGEPYGGAGDLVARDPRVPAAAVPRPLDAHGKRGRIAVVGAGRAGDTSHANATRRP